MPALQIRNGRVICPLTQRDEVADVFVEDGKIVHIEKSDPSRTLPHANSTQGRQADEVIDATGCIVAPGFIDLHVHLREPGREDCETIESGAAAAAAGGFTAICAMPNTTPVNDNVTTTQRILKQAESRAAVRVFPIAAVTCSSAGESLTDFEALLAAGCVAFSDDGKAVRTELLMHEALRRVKQAGTFVSDHCEDLAQAAWGVIHEGAVARELGVKGIPRQSEDSIVGRDIRIAAQTGAHVHIAHLSTLGALECVREAKREGIAVTCEVTPHHFTLSDDAVRKYGSNAKMRPPLRAVEDVQALLEGLADGTIDAIATDHAPHSRVEKDRGLEGAPFGIIGLETAVSLAIQRLLQPGIMSWPRLIELLSANPASILRRSDLGRLQIGSLADLTIIDPALEWTYDVAQSRSRSRNTPFHGWSFRGKAVVTVVGGRVAYKDRLG